MKIKFQDNSMTFNDLAAGEVFLCNNMVLMKLQDNVKISYPTENAFGEKEDRYVEVNALNLETGKMWHIESNVKVIMYKAELNITQIEN